MDLIAQADLPGLGIVKYPDPVLRGVCAQVEQFDDDLGRLASRMFEIMYAAPGVGLAAPQVGVPIQLFVFNAAGEPGENEGVCVNPRIVARDGQFVQEEGCLSVPGITCKLKRFARVTIDAQDLQGGPFQLSGEELLARIFQHEIDHLNGILVIDRMSAVRRLASRRTLKELEEDYRDGQAG